MTLLYIKTLILKVLSWLKDHIYVPILLIVMLVMVITYWNKVESLKKIIEVNKQSYAKEIAVINKSYEQEKKAKAELVTQHAKELQLIKDTYDKEIKDLQDMQNKEKDKLDQDKKSYIDDMHNDPDAVSKEIDDYAEGAECRE